MIGPLIDVTRSFDNAVKYLDDGFAQPSQEREFTELKETRVLSKDEDIVFQGSFEKEKYPEKPLQPDPETFQGHIPAGRFDSLGGTELDPGQPRGVLKGMGVRFDKRAGNAQFFKALLEPGIVAGDFTQAHEDSHASASSASIRNFAPATHSHFAAGHSG
jgi:hypothetical protein